MVLEKLGEGLRAALDKITRAGLVDRSVVEELVKDIQRTLLASDVDVKLVFELTQKIKKRALDEKPQAGMTAREHIIKIVYGELVSFVGRKADVKLRGKILLCGLFGSGKTTTAGKLAKFYQKKGLKVGLICCDAFRPAAYEQLQQIADQIGVPFFGIKGEKDSSKILHEGLKKIGEKDIIIIDSSGRDALDKEMIDEIKDLNTISAADERLLVLPADIGQAARAQAEEFQKALGITGVIITKLDGTAKGGGALTACAISGAPVKFIGVGEKIEAFEQFDPERFISRLVGFGDLQSLLEKAKESGAEESAKAIASGKFTLSEFYSQLEAMQKMGPLKSVLDSIPGFGMMKMPKEMDLGKQEGKMKKWKYIIQSMTKKEKESPDSIDGSRIRRIAKGSATTEAEVRELLKAFEQSKKVMKMVSGGGRRGVMGKMMKRFKGFG